MSDFYDVMDSAVRLRIKVIPGAARNQVVGIRAGELVVKVSAAPERGRANRELTVFLASELGIPKSGVRFESGATSRHKVLSLPRDTLDALRRLAE
jgi:uncharacterized protein (TIGR00251 family)